MASTWMHSSGHVTDTRSKIQLGIICYAFWLMQSQQGKVCMQGMPTHLEYEPGWLTFRDNFCGELQDPRQQAVHVCH